MEETEGRELCICTHPPQRVDWELGASRKGRKNRNRWKRKRDLAEREGGERAG